MRLYESLGPRLLLYLERRTGDPTLAADLVQDVFLRLLESPIRLDSPAEVKSYLYRTAHSRLVDHARRGRRDKSWRLWLRLDSPAIEAVDATDIGKVFRTLKPRDAALLWLAYVEEMNHNEIAKVLDAKPQSVKVLLHRARTELKSSMIRLGLATGDGRMTEDHAKSWMNELAVGGAGAQLPDFDRLWAMRRLEEEFERRRRITAPLEWLEIILQSAAGLALAALLTWWGTLS